MWSCVLNRCQNSQKSTDNEQTVDGTRTKSFILLFCLQNNNMQELNVSVHNLTTVGGKGVEVTRLTIPRREHNLILPFRSQRQLVVIPANEFNVSRIHLIGGKVHKFHIDVRDFRQDTYVYNTYILDADHWWFRNMELLDAVCRNCNLKKFQYPEIRSRRMRRFSVALKKKKTSTDVNHNNFFHDNNSENDDLTDEEKGLVREGFLSIEDKELPPDRKDWPKWYVPPDELEPADDYESEDRSEVTVGGTRDNGDFMPTSSDFDYHTDDT